MEVKSIELTKSQIKALQNGATMLMFPIDSNLDTEEKILSDLKISKCILQPGDKNIWIKEEVREFLHFGGGFDTTPASEMTKEQSRFTLDCINVRVSRVQDMSIIDMYNSLVADYKFTSEEMLINTFVEGYHTQIKEQNINRTHKDNDYVFLCDIKQEKDEL